MELAFEEWSIRVRPRLRYANALPGDLRPCPVKSLQEGYCSALQGVCEVDFTVVSAETLGQKLQ